MYLQPHGSPASPLFITILSSRKKNVHVNVNLQGRTVLNHDFVFWCGDFNYRLNMSRDEVKAAVEANNLEELLAADQLRIEQAAGNVFQGFQASVHLAAFSACQVSS
jgi:hypothetical protein